MRGAATKFTVDIGWVGLLESVGIGPQDLLRHAALPLDLFSQRTPELDAEAYFRLCNSMEALSGDPVFPLTLGQSLSPEIFSPPLFAAYCSPNLKTALERLQVYKPIIGPMVLDLISGSTELAVGIKAQGVPDLPANLILFEAVFLVHIARTATRRKIVPLKVKLREVPKELAAYRSFFGVPFKTADRDEVVFRSEDLHLPFLSVNDAMFDIFEPILRQRLSDLAQAASLTDRVRACLTEMLASGIAGVGDVAERLAVSPRTLQRKLAQEGTSFQQLLNEVREQAARTYLQKTRYSNAEIAFLLGYDDPNSFIRAYHNWTGVTPETSRQAMHLA
ncbi:AraC family transcriptional regulator [Roseibium denhamense]|uniref:AraC-type DNA-binding protein n=1 Tax=Roseibium denhamense TaxID=76305 RepID=A0ABY1NUI2_9HYPH|nr:AraC family transcriptional regulator [Roseibium denhamense]MTI05431.1 AraC family transcriptional regulator [Roseibium denhamense]SMP18680.1 AraC-type DNA-binding protein [Roseibium denhamense]